MGNRGVDKGGMDCHTAEGHKVLGDKRLLLQQVAGTPSYSIDPSRILNQ